MMTFNKSLYLLWYDYMSIAFCENHSCKFCIFSQKAIRKITRAKINFIQSGKQSSPWCDNRHNDSKIIFQRDLLNNPARNGIKQSWAETFMRIRRGDILLTRWEKTRQCLKGQSNEIFDLHFFFIMRTFLGPWLMG